MPLGAERCAACGAAAGGAAMALHEGIKHFEAERYPEALAEFERARQIASGDADVRRCYAHGLRYTGQPEQALVEYRELQAEDPHDPETRYGIGRILMDQGRLNHARSVFEALVKDPVEIEPGRFLLGTQFETPAEFKADCCYHIAIASWNQGEIEATSHYFQRALELDPDHAASLRHLGNLVYQVRKFDQAIGCYEHYLEMLDGAEGRQEDTLEVRCNLGIAYYEVGKIAEAIQHLNKVLADRPGHPRAIYHMNLIYEREGMYPQKADMPAPSVEDSDRGSMIFGLSAPGASDAAVFASSDDSRPIIGKSVAMQKVLRLARLAAASDATVLLTGENGTGKELIARSIHDHSNRRDQIFLPVNCAAIPESLIESELFGHEAGAFTGATGRKKGKFEAAHKGTLFLDEVGELDLNMQVKLLRVLQEREFSRVGGNESIRTDVRIIAATNRDLEAMIEEGTFRQDLYFRINVLPIHIPPLRERREEIPMLIDYFVYKYGKGSVKTSSLIKDEDLEIMMEYEWPGNIRELENVIERAMVLGTQAYPILQGIARGRRPRGESGDGGGRNSRGGDGNSSGRRNEVVELSMGGNKHSAPGGEWEPLPIRELEKRHILNMLQHTEGNRSEAARMLGINPTTLWRKMKTYRIED